MAYDPKYDQYRNAFNSYNNNGEWRQATMQDYQRTKLDEAHIRAQIKILEDQLNSARMEGPSRYELEKHESLNEAWKAYLVVRKLLGLDDK